MSEPRTRTAIEVADHASILQEELQTAQGQGYIRPIDDPDPDGIHPSLPGFKYLSNGSLNLTAHGERVDWRVFDAVCDHVRFLEHAVERLAAQVEDLAAYVHIDVDDGDESEVVVEVGSPDDDWPQPGQLSTVDHLKEARRHLGDAIALETNSGDKAGLADLIARPAIDLHVLLERIAEGQI